MEVRAGPGSQEGPGRSRHCLLEERLRLPQHGGSGLLELSPLLV